MIKKINDRVNSLVNFLLLSLNQKRMKKILLFGAGKSATVLIEYLIGTVEKEGWQLTVVDTDLELVKSKIGKTQNAIAKSFDIANDDERKKHIEAADIAISLLPPALHYIVAKDCLELNKNLLTASYVDENIRGLSSEIEKRQLLFLCEMGLDPGIDHMSAMKLIDEVHSNGGTIISFKSHCGGLVAPESNDNPWKYKVSWNPKNIVLAGKSGAMYKYDSQVKNEQYEDLFDGHRLVDTGIDEIGVLSYYPNRNSLPYIDLYNLAEADTFI